MIYCRSKDSTKESYFGVGEKSVLTFGSYSEQEPGIRRTQFCSFSDSQFGEVLSPLWLFPSQQNVENLSLSLMGLFLEIKYYTGKMYVTVNTIKLLMGIPCLNH